MSFHALEIAIELIEALQPLIAKVAKRNPPLAKQLAKSSESIAQNLSEGRERQGGDQRYHYTVAHGSAAESQTSLRIAVAQRAVTRAEAAVAFTLLDRELAMCWRLTHPR